MPSHLEKSWRLLQTGLSFAVFGGIVLALGFVAIPLSRRLARDPQPDDLRAQRWIHRGARCFIGFARGIGLMRVDRVGTDRLRAGGPLLVVANHPTWLIELSPNGTHDVEFVTAREHRVTVGGCGSQVVANPLVQAGEVVTVTATFECP